MHPGYVPDKVISDAELVVLARAGEAGAFGMLVERHRAALYAAALAVLGDRDAAMDAVQEAFMVALTRLNSIRDPAAVGRWLRMVVRNCALMQIRRVRHEIVGGNPEAWASTPGPEQVLEEHALRDWVWAAIEALAEEERITLVLRHFTRCRTYEAIAAITGVPVGTAQPPEPRAPASRRGPGRPRRRPAARPGPPGGIARARMEVLLQPAARRARTANLP
jgi:RNA polymerase sigma-70 factor (ECF subfamily)